MSAAPKPDVPDRTTIHPDGAVLLLALLCGFAGYLLAYLGVIPVLKYLPVPDRWTLNPGPDAIYMAYYGVLLDGALAFLAAYGIGRVPAVARRIGRPGAVRWLVRSVVVLTMAAFLVVAAKEIVHWSGVDAEPVGVEQESMPSSPER